MDEFESSERPAEKAGEHAAEGAKDIKSAVGAKAEEIRTAAQTPLRDIHRLLHAEHDDPFGVLGLHRIDQVRVVRSF
jgi:hypothetical protein